MYKKMILAAVLLAGCSNETKQLENQKTQLQSEIKNLNSQISDEKSQAIVKDNTITQLNSKLNLEKGTSSQMTFETYTQHFHTYTTALSNAFSDYSSIQHEVSELKKDPEVLDQLKTIEMQVAQSTKTFNDAFVDESVPESYIEIHKQVLSANQAFTEAMAKLVTAYEKSDADKFQKANQQLNDGINTIDNIQFH